MSCKTTQLFCQNVYFDSETSSCPGNPNSETSGDSKNAFLHHGDVLVAPKLQEEALDFGSESQQHLLGRAWESQVCLYVMPDIGCAYLKPLHQHLVILMCKELQVFAAVVQDVLQAVLQICLQDGADKKNVESAWSSAHV